MERLERKGGVEFAEGDEDEVALAVKRVRDGEFWGVEFDTFVQDDVNINGAIVVDICDW